MSDCEMLLGVVRLRLRASVAGMPETNGGLQAGVFPDRIKANVLQCANDLGALQIALSEDLGRCRRLECELADMQAALQRCRIELADTRQAERREHHLALHDSLTGLPNRRCLSDQLDRALTDIEPARPVLAVFYLDLDSLKAINDLHGHDTGDELLRIVAARLRAALRAKDVVCRLGGDEFACLLTDLLNREQLAQLACNLFDTVSAPMQIGERRIAVRPSIGIATCPADGNTGAALLRHADTAMYCAKREQTGYAFFSEPPVCRITRLAPRVAASPAAPAADLGLLREA